MRIEIIVARGRWMRWQAELAGRLAASGHVVTSAAVDDGPVWPTSVALILDVERLTARRRGKRPSDQVAPWVPPFPLGESEPALSLDLSGREGGETAHLKVLYDGSPDPAAAVDALLDGRRPRIDVVNDGRVIEAGAPAVDNPAHLLAGLDGVFARVADLVGRAVSRLASGSAAASAPIPSIDHVRSPWMGARVASHSLAALAAKARRALVRRLQLAEGWHVGVRRLAGADSLDRGELPTDAYAWLPDDGARYFADPFLLRHQGRTWLFVEEYPFATRKGVIAVCELMPDGSFGESRVVLEEREHLSYPLVFVDGGQVWMIPESSSANELVLYRATSFPWQWQRERTLVSGSSLSDATPLLHDGRLWIFAAETGMHGGSTCDALSLFSAPDLAGEFVPHALNPVLVDVRAARPAGRMLRRGGRLLRVAQDCGNGYGTGITVATIDRLDEDDYRQTVVGSLTAPSAWAASGLHTIEIAGGLEAVDIFSARAPAERSGAAGFGVGSMDFVA